ncbi:GMP reductase [Candidatus Woesearchaeota archaeon]|nr:MAG: GMP reductase [Candidatus Woesearchaeota archaeon]
MRIDNDPKLDFDDVLIRPKRSTLVSRADVVLEREFKFIHSHRTWKGIPIATSNMDSCGTFEMAKELSKYKMLTVLHKFYSVKELEKFLPKFNNPDYISYCLGIRDDDFKKLREVMKKGLHKYFNFVCLDVPNAYLEVVVGKLKELRKLLPRHTIIAGNVVTNEMTEELLLSGADIVKIGIGPGSMCLTRRKTGVGYPQLSATIECADAAHGISNTVGVGLIMTDGGLRYPADLAKAFGAGADFIMSGALFSGFKQSGGKLIVKNGKKYKEYYGSSSDVAMKRHYGKVEKYRAVEGRYTLIPYKGDVNDFVLDLLGSLRSTATYIGARRLKEFSRRTTFIMVHRQLNTSLENYEADK